MFRIHGGPRIPPQSTLEADTHVLPCNNAFHFRIPWVTARGTQAGPASCAALLKLSWKLCAQACSCAFLLYSEASPGLCTRVWMRNWVLRSLVLREGHGAYTCWAMTVTWQVVSYNRRARPRLREEYKVQTM